MRSRVVNAFARVQELSLLRLGSRAAAWDGALLQRLEHPECLTQLLRHVMLRRQAGRVQQALRLPPIRCSARSALEQLQVSLQQRGQHDAPAQDAACSSHTLGSCELLMLRGSQLAACLAWSKVALLTPTHRLCLLLVLLLRAQRAARQEQAATPRRLPMVVPLGFSAWPGWTQVAAVARSTRFLSRRQLSPMFRAWIPTVVRLLGVVEGLVRQHGQPMVLLLGFSAWPG